MKLLDQNKSFQFHLQKHSKEVKFDYLTIDQELGCFA